MKKCRIAILDSGCCEYQLENMNVICKKNFIDLSEDVRDEHGHGTASFYIIHHMVQEAEYLILKVLDKNAYTKISVILSALEFLLTVETDFICMCLSTAINSNNDKMYLLCEALTKQGKKIIASRANALEDSYPAEFNNVIGVEGILMREHTDFWYNKEHKIQVVSDLTPIMVPYNDYKRWHMFGGNSKATAIFCGLLVANNKNDIYHFMEQNNSRTVWTEADIRAGKIYNNKLLKRRVDNKTLYEAILLALKPYYGEIEEKTNLHTSLTPDNYFDVLYNLERKLQLSLDYCNFKYSDFDTIISLYEKIEGVLNPEKGSE